MPQRAWSAKRERQYEHVKDSAEQRGVGEKRAEDIAARTVNKNRAQAGESGSNNPAASGQLISCRSARHRVGDDAGRGVGHQPVSALIPPA